MSLQYVGLNEINGPLVVLDHVKGASYDEMVDIQLKDGTTRAGRIVQIEGEKVVVQVFEGTNGLSLENTKTRLLGKPMELPVSKEILGRIFSGAGRPIDGLGEVYAEAEMDINGLKFSELPECFQNAIKEFNLTVCLTDNASQDEVADTFYNLNNGQALNTATLNRVKAKSLDKIVELGNHTLFTEALSQVALNGHVNEDLVAKAHAMLYDHEPSMETKYIRPYMKDTEFTEEHVNTLRNVFDYIKKIHDGIENKKIAKRIYSRTHLISIVPMINRAIEEGKDEYKVTKWIESFYNGSRSATISKSYNDAAGSGSAKKESVRKRMNELEKNYNMFFKDYEADLDPVINPEKKKKNDNETKTMVSEVKNNMKIENEIDETTNNVA